MSKIIIVILCVLYIALCGFILKLNKELKKAKEKIDYYEWIIKIYEKRGKEGC